MLQDWPIVLATFIGPIVAVAITLWHQSRERVRRERDQLFATMMRLRRHPLMTEYVGALNLVPVHFSRDTNVMRRYEEIYALLNDPAWELPAAVARLNERVEVASAHLLSTMAVAQGVKIDQLQILRGAYAPRGWQDEENILRALRMSLLSALQGGALRVAPMNAPAQEGGGRPGHPDLGSGPGAPSGPLDSPPPPQGEPSTRPPASPVGAPPDMRLPGKDAGDPGIS
jgi:hypothetical protein